MPKRRVLYLSVLQPKNLNSLCDEFTAKLEYTLIYISSVSYSTCTVAGSVRQPAGKNDVREIIFRLVSLPQESQPPSDEHAVYQPKRKPPPPKMTHVQRQPSKSVPKKVTKVPVQKKVEAATDEEIDPTPKSPPVDLAAVAHTQAGNSTPGNMPVDPVLLSVICPELTTPTYPKPSRQLGEFGKVVLRLELSESGVVKSAQVVNSSGYKRLDEAAITAARTWRCDPPHRNGRPVSAIVLQPFIFVLQ